LARINEWSVGKFRQSRTKLNFRAAEVDGASVKSDTKVFPNIQNRKVAENSKTLTVAKKEVDDPAKTVERMSFGIIPVAAAMGYAIVPSRKWAFKAAGAAAGGIAGFFAKSALDKRLENIYSLSEFQNLEEQDVELDKDTLISDKFFRFGFSSEVVAAVKTTLKSRSDLLTYTSEALERIALSKGVKENELSLFFTTVLCEAMLKETSGKSLDLLELTALIDFVNEMRFSRHEIGNAFGFAAIRIGKTLEVDDRGFFRDNFPIATLLQAAKLFFLADKLIGDMDGFYGKRVSMLLNSFFLEESYQTVITQSCQRLFGLCVQAVLSSSSPLGKSDVKLLESFLATSNNLSEMRPANMKALVLEAIRSKLEADLQPFSKATAINAVLPDYDIYQQAREIFEWDRIEMIATIDARVLPVYTDIVKEVLRAVHDDPSLAKDFEDTLLAKARDLHISIPKARALLIDVVKSYNDAYLDRVEKVYTASQKSLSAVYKIMITQAHVVDAFEMVSRQIMQGSKLSLPGLPFSASTRQLLFRYRKEATTVKKARSDSTLEEMFELSDAERQIVLQSITTPKIVAWVAQCIAENTLTTGAKEAYRKMLKEHNISDISWQPTAMDFYYQEVKKIAEMRAIPTSEDMIRLDTVREFLLVPESSSQNVHLDLFGEKYIKAVTESMSLSGVISEEYAPGLVRLRERLGLTEENARILGAVAARNRLAPMIESLVDIWKCNTDFKYALEKEKREREESNSLDKNQNQNHLPSSSKRRRKSSSLDSIGFVSVNKDLEAMKKENSPEDDIDEVAEGPGNFMQEAMNIVEMISSNLAVHGVDQTVSNGDFVNALSMVPESDLVGVFKYFLLGRLTERNPSLRQRYENAEPSVISMLGILGESVEAIKESVAYSSFKSVLHNALLHKDTVDGSDLQQFVGLKKLLPLKNDTIAEMIFMDARKHALIDHAAAVFAKFLGNATNHRTGKKYAIDPVLQSAFPQLKTRSVSPMDARQFRIQVSSMGLTMREVGFTPSFLSLLFALEVQYAIDQKQENELSELHEIYEIDANSAEAIVEASVTRYLAQVIALALTAAKRYNEPVAVQHMVDILRYLPFISDSAQVAADGNMFSQEDVERLIAFYLVEIDSQLSAVQEERDDLRQLQDEQQQELSTESQEKLQAAEERLATLSSIDRHAISEKLTHLIRLDRSFVPPQQGIGGLMGELRKETDGDEIELSQARKKWSWD
jgi:hypothetical protein